MPPVDNVNLSPYSADAADIERKRALAQALQSQSMQPIETSGFNGIPAPISPFQGLAKLLQGYTAGQGMKQAKEQEQALYQRQKDDRSKDMRLFAQALSGNTALAGPDGVAQPDGVMPVGNETTKMLPGQRFNPAMLDQIQDPAIQAMALALMKPKDPIKLGKGDTLVDPNTYRQIAAGPGEDFTLPPGAVRYGADGKQIVSAPEKAAKTPADDLRASMIAAGILPDSPEGKSLFVSLAKKEATHQPPATTSVKIDNKLGEGIAKEVGPMLGESRSAALGALDQLDASKRITAALDSGKVIAGPGATVRMIGDQIGQVLGVGGSDSAERLTNTRAVIKGLAEYTIGARKALKGQGAVSDYEGSLITKASSGDIDNMTLPEIRALVATTERLAKKQHQAHSTQLATMRKKENLRDLADFFEVPDLPDTTPTGPQLSPTAQQYLQRARGGK